MAPQALFFLNDPFVSENARALAARVAREEPGPLEARVQRLYALVLGRPPAQAELEIGLKLLTDKEDALPWERYCHLFLSQNEIVYTD